MSGEPTVVVVGSSVAGVRCVQALRGEGYTGRIVLVGEEAELPYDKPPLSKQFLAGQWDADRVRLLTPDGAAELDVELRLGSPAERLDIAARQVDLADGSTLDYDDVVLATGAAARPSPWPCDSGVHVVRSLDDARALRVDLQADVPVVVVGGGFIGAEVAATVHALGRDVTIVDPMSTPIGRVVGEQLGQAFTELHGRHGVATRFGTGVESVAGRAGDLVVSLGDGSTLRAGTVVVGIGAVPNDEWLRGSGLDIDDGVLCDEHCRAVGADRVFVVGDLARWCHPGRGSHRRVEHWTNAVDSAAVAAHNIARPGDLRSHSAVEYVWSDQYDWRIQILGRPALGDRLDVFGAFAGDAAKAAALATDAGGTVVHGVVTVNWPKALVTARRSMAADVAGDELRAQLAALSVARVPA